MSAGMGMVVLFGSGETSAAGQKVFDWLLHRMAPPVQVAVLETPAGFELNSARVAGRIGDFLSLRLQNYRPQVTLVPARKRGTPNSPDEPEIAALIPHADLVFLGPGSPTYAIRQLRDSLTWQSVVASHRLGASLVLASAATVAISAHALPVYEIYKVGEELHWHQGLDFFGPYGLSLAFIPHWNNQDGGAELDTRHCFMGQARFGPLLEMLPAPATVVGLDEHTALAIDLSGESCHVLGRGGVALIRQGQQERVRRGQTFSIQELGPFRQPDPELGLPPRLLSQVRAARFGVHAVALPEPPVEATALVEQREAARRNRDWAAADALRSQIKGLGWQVMDTPDGPRLEPV